MLDNEKSISSFIYPQVRSLFSKYENVDHYAISNFITSVPNLFSEVVTHISRLTATDQYPSLAISEYGMNARLELKKAISKFHKDANTFTTKVGSAIENLNDPATRIFVSTHQ